MAPPPHGGVALTASKDPPWRSGTYPAVLVSPMCGAAGSLLLCAGLWAVSSESYVLRAGSSSS